MAEVSNLASALAKAQAVMAGAKRDNTNPHFRSKYADLASVWEACRKPLADNGLSVVQFTQIDTCGPILVTRLLHVSGESIDGICPLLTGKQDMQALGSAITYARRYGLAAMVGIAPEDDDGNEATASAKMTAQDVVNHMRKPAGFGEWSVDLEAAADNGLNALKEAWTKAKPEFRDFLNTIAPNALNELKAKAAKVTT